MINRTEYETICKLIKKGDLEGLQKYIDFSYETGYQKYLKEAKEALVAYLEYYPQSFINYLDESKSNENPLVDSLFHQIKNDSKIIVISDNVTGGFILYNDEIIDESEIQKQHIFRKKGYALSSVDFKKVQSIKIIKDILEKINKRNLRLISLEEKSKKEVAVYGKGYAHPHYFERTRFESFKLLGEDAKIYVSLLKDDPMLYGESSKGKGFVLGLKK